MAPNKDYHAILGIPQSASLEDVKKAYKQLAREWHPDKNSSAEATARFRQVWSARTSPWHLLNAAQIGNAYDKLREAKERQLSGSPGHQVHSEQAPGAQEQGRNVFNRRREHEQQGCETAEARRRELEDLKKKNGI